MTYRSGHPKVDGIDFEGAWEMACQLDSGLRKQTLDEKTLQDALTSLARRVAQLEEEWS